MSLKWLAGPPPVYVHRDDDCSIDFVQHFQLHCQSNSQHCSSSSSSHAQLHIQPFHSFGLADPPKQRPAHANSTTAAKRAVQPV